MPLGPIGRLKRQVDLQVARASATSDYPTALASAKNVRQVQKTNLSPTSSSGNQRPVSPISLRSFDDLGVDEYKLENGLRVITLPALDGSDNFDADLIIHAGAGKDPKERSGLAHLLEHLLGTQTMTHVEKEDLLQLANITSSVANAATDSRLTQYYYETMPNEFLDEILSAQASILKPGTRITQQELDDEKLVIANELSTTSHTSEEEDALRDRFLYPENSPDAVPTGGLTKDLKNISLKDLQEWKNKFYQPANSTLILRSNMDKFALINKIKAIFGPIENTVPVDKKQVDQLQASANGISSFDYKHPIYNHMVMSFQFPAANQYNLYHLNQFKFTLQDRLDDALVYGDLEGVGEIGVSSYEYGDSSELSIEIDIDQDIEEQDPEFRNKVIAKVVSEIERLKNEPLSQHEIDYINMSLDETRKAAMKDRRDLFELIRSTSYANLDWKTQVENLKSAKADSAAVNEFAKKFINTANYKLIHYIQDDSYEGIEPATKELNGTDFGLEDLEMKLPQVLKNRDIVSSIKSDIEPKIDEFEAIKIVRVAQRNLSNIIFSFEKLGGEENLDDKEMLADLSGEFLKFLLNVSPEGKRKKEEEFLQKYSSRPRPFIEKSSQGFSLTMGADKKADLPSYLKDTLEFIDLSNYDEEYLQSILEKSKRKILMDFDEWSNIPEAKVRVEYEKHQAYATGSDKYPDITALQAALGKLKVDDIQAYLQRAFSPAHGQVYILGDFQDSDLENLKPSISQWKQKFGDETKPRFANYELQTPKDIKVEDADEESPRLMLGKLWKIDSSEKDSFTLQCIMVQYLFSQKLFKLFRKLCPSVYSSHFSIDALNGKTAHTLVDLNVEKDIADDIKKIILKSLSLVAQNGFSEEEIKLAKLYTVYREAKNREDEYHLPYKYLKHAPVKFDDYKKKVFSIPSSQINSFTKRALDPQAMSFAAAA